MSNTPLAREAKEGSIGASELAPNAGVSNPVYHKGADEALKVLGDATISHAPITEEEVKRLRRKIDFRIVPALWLVLGKLLSLCLQRLRGQCRNAMT